MQYTNEAQIKKFYKLKDIIPVIENDISNTFFLYLIFFFNIHFIMNTNVITAASFVSINHRLQSSTPVNRNIKSKD